MLNSVVVSLLMTTGKAVLSLFAGLAFGFVLLTLIMPTEVMAIALFRLVGITLQWGDTSGLS